jgi:hypothetical protein
MILSPQRVNGPIGPQKVPLDPLAASGQATTVAAQSMRVSQNSCGSSRCME